jgi:hypothetical protein
MNHSNDLVLLLVPIFMTLSLVLLYWIIILSIFKYMSGTILIQIGVCRPKIRFSFFLKRHFLSHCVTCFLFIYFAKNND